MKVAIPVTDNKVGRPGEALEVHIYQINENEIKLLEKHENPALKATGDRGLYMLKLAIDKGAKAIIVSDIRPPGVEFLKGKAKIYLARGLTVNEALQKLIKGELVETDKATMD